MSASGEVDDVEMPVEPKPVKEMKPKASQQKKPKQTKSASHPPYFEMVKEALLALKERNGSSPYAIAKYMEEKFKPVLPANFKKILSLQLKNQTMRGKLVKIKASYKLSDAEKPKKEKKNAASEVKKAKGAEKKQKSQKRKKNGTVGDKKSNKKKEKKSKVSEPGKPKQPKSIKSTTNKRARKANVCDDDQIIITQTM